jgi:hypothetical protein
LALAYLQRFRTCFALFLTTRRKKQNDSLYMETTQADFLFPPFSLELQEPTYIGPTQKKYIGTLHMPNSSCFLTPLIKLFYDKSSDFEEKTFLKLPYSDN